MYLIHCVIKPESDTQHIWHVRSATALSASLAIPMHCEVTALTWTGLFVSKLMSTPKRIST